MSNQNNHSTFSAFKKAQIRYRRQGNDPCRTDDLPEVLDFGIATDDRIIELTIPEEFQKNYELYQGPIYGLKGFPGFLFAPQAMDEELQTVIAFECVTKFCESPHRTNIHLNPPKPSELPNVDESMWDLWKKSKKDAKSTANLNKESKKRKLQQARQKSYRTFKKLSWATMGYHYDWTERSYSKEAKSTMPVLLSDLSKIFARTSLALDSGGKSDSSTADLHFAPEASIVNYYNTKSLMGGHRDELEMALDKPVVSLSTGLSAIFLLGGKTKEEEPVVPILIRPGDVMCLGGDARLNYHSMARVLPHTVSLPNASPSCCDFENQKVTLQSINGCQEKNEDSHVRAISVTDSSALNEYLMDHRININVRQVYP